MHRFAEHQVDPWRHIAAHRAVHQFAQLLFSPDTGGVGAVGQCAGQHLVSDDAEGKQIGTGGGGVAGQDLGRRVLDGAEDVAAIQGRCRFRYASDGNRTEVDDFHRAVSVDHDIFGA